MTAPKSFGGFSQDDVRKYLEGLNQKPPKPEEKPEKKSRKKKIPESPAVPDPLPAIPAVPVPAPTQSKSLTTDPTVFGIEKRLPGRSRAYRMSNVWFIDRYCTVDFDTSTFPIGKRTQEHWIKSTKDQLAQEPDMQDVYIGCAPLYYSIWKTLYAHKDSPAFVKAVENARSELESTLNFGEIMTLSQILWKPQELDTAVHDIAIPPPYPGYSRRGNLKGQNGSLSNVVTDARSFCKAVFDEPDANWFCEVIKWLTGNEPFLIRWKGVDKPVTNPVMFEPGKFCYVNASSLPNTIRSGTDKSAFVNTGYGLPVRIHSLLPNQGGSQ